MSNSECVRFQYDCRGNRNVVDAAGREWRYEYDAFDSVLREEAVMVGRDAPIAPQTFAISHDLDGNLTNDGKSDKKGFFYNFVVKKCEVAIIPT